MYKQKQSLLQIRPNHNVSSTSKFPYPTYIQRWSNVMCLLGMYLKVLTKVWLPSCLWFLCSELYNYLTNYWSLPGWSYSFILQITQI